MAATHLASSDRAASDRPTSSDPGTHVRHDPSGGDLNGDATGAGPGPARTGPALVRSLAIVAGLVAVAGAGFTRLFADSDVDVLVGVGAVLPVVLVGVLGRRRRPMSLTITSMVWVGAFVAWSACTVATGAGGLWSRIRLVGTGLSGGWARLLDVAVPAPTDPVLLLVPAALTWLAAAAGAEIALRTGTRLLPAAPGVVLLAVATAYTAPAPGSNVPLAAAVAALAALLAAVRRPERSELVEANGELARRSDAPPDRRDDLRTVAPAVMSGGDRPTGRTAARVRVRSAAAVALVVAAGLLVAMVLPGPGASAPADPRSLRRATPASALPGLSPLSALAGWTARPDQVLLRMRTSPVTPGPMTLRLAVLDAYDGATWSASGRYRPASHSLAPASPDPDRSAPARSGEAGPGPTTVTQDLDIAGLGGNPVPALAQLRQFRSLPGIARSGDVPAGRDPAGSEPAGSEPADSEPAGGGSGDRFAVDVEGGTLLRRATLTPGSRLRLTSAPPAGLAVDDLLALQVSPGAGESRYLAVPTDIPAVLGQLANVAAARDARPYQRAAMLRHYLASTFTFDPTAPPGHSLAQIATFLDQTRRGTSEQFATTFVLAARLLGLPARLVVGFSAAPDPQGGTRVVRGADALAWAEVHFDGVGWLPFFPTPRAGDAAPASAVGPTQGESPEQTSLVSAVLHAAPAVVAPPSVGGGPSSDGHRPAGLPGVASHPAGLVTALAAVALVLGIGYVGLALLVPVAVRRRARRDPSNRGRVVSAWRQAMDVLEDAGTPIPRSASPSEVVGIAAGRLGNAGAAALRGLADLATVALFEADTGRWSGVTGRRSSDEAWRLLDGLRRAVHDQLPRPRRVRRRFTPAVVWTEVRRLRGSALLERRRGVGARPRSPVHPPAMR